MYELMIKYIKIVFLFSFCTVIVNAYEVKNIAHAVDVAGKQRMFTQRMLKNYVMIGMKNNFANPTSDLSKIMKDFEEHLDGLITFNKEANTKASLLKVKKLWIPIKSELNKSPQKSKAGEMQEALENLLAKANEATFSFAKQSKNSSGEIINISGRQRMLSQRMASLYMLKVWGVNDPKFKDKMEKAMNLFKTSAKKLMTSTLNTPNIDSLLKNVNKSFMFFEMMNKSKSKFIPSLIYKKSDDILKDMNTVTGLYVIEENG